jgi:hypothetical protein
MLMLTAVASSRTVIRRFSCTNVSTAAIFSSVMTDTCPGRGGSAVDTRPPRNSTHHLNTVLRLRHASPYTSFIRRKMSLGDAPSLHKNWMTPRCSCLDASIRRTCCYNFHHYTAHTCRRLTLFCAGTTYSLLCTPATTWPPRKLLALLPHVSIFHLNNPYIQHHVVQLHLLPKSRMVELYLHCPLRLHDVVFNYLSTLTTSSVFTFTVKSKSLNKTQVVH